MAWSERKLTEGFGVELTGAAIGPDLPKTDRAAIYDATARCGVAVLPDQDLSDDDIYELANSLGHVVHVESLEGVPPCRVMPLGNLDPQGNILPPDDWVMRQNLANELWHIDLTFMRPRASISMLYGLVVPPEGGNTEFCDTRLAFEALSAEEQLRLEAMTASHSLMHSRARYGFTEWTAEALERFSPVSRPLVDSDPETGRKSLCVASHIFEIAGLAREETTELVGDLIDRATVPANCYSHRWRKGDLVLWDNRCVMHRATPFDMALHRRDMRAIRLFDPANA